MTEEGALSGNRYDVVPGDERIPSPTPVTHSLFATTIAHNEREVHFFS